VKTPRGIPPGDSGFILMQVVVTSALLLLVLLSGFVSVRNAIKSTGTVATSADFKDLVQRARIELATTGTCMVRLGLNFGDPIGNLQVPGGTAVAISDITGKSFAYEEDAVLLPPNRYPAPLSFKMVRVRIAGFGTSVPASAAWTNKTQMPPGGNMSLAHYAAQIVIQGRRRSNTAVSAIPLQLPGIQDMFATIPILFTVDANTSQLRGCTTRSVYQIPLGPESPPIANRRFGIDCLDRGGAVVPDPNGQPFSVCRLPDISFAVCDPADLTLTTIPGWRCHIKSNGTVTYAY